MISSFQVTQSLKHWDSDVEQELTDWQDWCDAAECALLLMMQLTFAVATTIGTTIAFLLVPMKSLGQDSWKIAAALMGSYIGGGKSSLPAKWGVYFGRI